jgi:hypothetical protein
MFIIMWYCVFNDVCVEYYCTLFIFVPSFRYHRLIVTHGEAMYLSKT